MNENSRLIKNTAIIAVGSLSTKLVSFFLLPLYTSILSTSEYGVVDYVTTLSVFCVPFVSLLLDESMFRFLIDCKTDQERSRVISQSMLVILAGSIVFAAVALAVLHALRYAYTLYLVLYVLSAVLVTMTSALLRGIGRIDLYALFNCLNSVFNIVLNVLFIAAFRWGVRGMLLAAVLAQFGVSTVFLLGIRSWRYMDFKAVDRKDLVRMIRYSVPLIPNKLSWTIINMSNRLVIMNMIGSDAAGLYAVSNKFPGLMDTVYGFFYQSWKESSARVVGMADSTDFYNAVYRNLKDLLFSLVLIMIAFMPLAFRVLINEAFAEAILYVPLLLLATYFSNISGFYGGIFTAYMQTKIMGVTTAVSAAVNLAGGIVLVRFWGLYGASLATLGASILVCGYRRIKVRKYAVLREDGKKQIVSAAVLAAVVGAFYSGNVWCYTAGAVLALGYAFWANKALLQSLRNRFAKR